METPKTGLLVQFHHLDGGSLHEIARDAVQPDEGMVQRQFAHKGHFARADTLQHGGAARADGRARSNSYQRMIAGRNYWLNIRAEF